METDFKPTSGSVLVSVFSFYPTGSLLHVGWEREVGKHGLMEYS